MWRTCGAYGGYGGGFVDASYGGGFVDASYGGGFVRGRGLPARLNYPCLCGGGAGNSSLPWLPSLPPARPPPARGRPTVHSAISPH